MSAIALYHLLKRIPHATDTEIERAIVDVAQTKDVATKADIAELKSELKDDISELKGDIRELRTELKYLRWLIVFVVGIAVGIIKYL